MSAREGIVQLFDSASSTCRRLVVNIVVVIVVIVVVVVVVVVARTPKWAIVAKRMLELRVGAFQKAYDTIVLFAVARDGDEMRLEQFVKRGVADSYALSEQLLKPSG